MNNERRRALRRWSKKVEELKSELEDILWDEQTAYDNLRDQFSERDMASEEAINQMEDTIEDLEDVIETIDNIII